MTGQPTQHTNALRPRKTWDTFAARDSQSNWTTLPLIEIGLLVLSVLLLAVDLTNSGGAIFAGDDGKFLAWIWHRVETGLYAPYATRTSPSVNMILGGGTSLFLIAPLTLGSPLIATGLILSAFTSVVTLWLLFDIGKLLNSRFAGLIAVLVYLPVQNTDLRMRELIFLVPLFLAGLDLTIRLMQNGRDSLYIWLALTLGLMINTHYQGLLLLVALSTAFASTFDKLPQARGTVLLATVSIAMIFAATPVMALSLLPNWTVYTLLIAMFLLPKLSLHKQALLIFLAITLLMALVTAPHAILEGFRRLLRPISGGSIQGICLATGAASFLFLLTRWISKGFSGSCIAESLIIPLLLVITIIGSAVLDLAFSISWRPYFWRPTYAILCLASGVVIARLIGMAQPRALSRLTTLLLILCLSAITITEAVDRRLSRPNIKNEMSLDETRAIVEALVTQDGIPEIHDDASLYTQKAYQFSLLYRLHGKNNTTPDRQLIAYLEKDNDPNIKIIQQHPWLHRQKIGRYVLFWFTEDPHLSQSPLISLNDKNSSLEIFP